MGAPILPAPQLWADIPLGLVEYPAVYRHLAGDILHLGDPVAAFHQGVVAALPEARRHRVADGSAHLVGHLQSDVPRLVDLTAVLVAGVRRRHRAVALGRKNLRTGPGVVLKEALAGLGVDALHVDGEGVFVYALGPDSFRGLEDEFGDIGAVVGDNGEGFVWVHGLSSFTSDSSPQ